MKRKLFFIIGVLIANTICAQTINDILNGDVYAAQVKLIDEFIDRFNLQEIRKDVNNFEDKNEANLLLLFDLEKYASEEDVAFYEVKEFVDKVIHNKIQIAHADSLWYANATIEGKLVGKKVQFNLLLSYVSRGDDMYKWVISDVKGDLFNLTDKIEEMYISPSAHEMEFLELKRMTSETHKFINSFIKDNHNYDALSAFTVLVRSGLLKIDFVSSLEFCFMQVPNHQFFVKYFPRETRNSGWLIDRIEPLSTEQRDSIQSVLYVQPQSQQQNFGLDTIQIKSKDWRYMFVGKGIPTE